jgi:diphthine-ammonia ligase
LPAGRFRLPDERSIVCSWSGGKDSCLALYRAVEAGWRPSVLLTMLTEGGRRTRSHGLPVEVIAAQAEALGLELVTRPASWAAYEPSFVEALSSLAPDVVGGVFGSIDVDEHRAWVERVSASAAIEPVLPLWREPRLSLLAELLDRGVDAVLVAVRDGAIPPELLGRRLDADLLDDLAKYAIDLCGEAGEYHTVVVDGPLFARPLDLAAGETVLRDGVWFLDVRL